MPKYRPVLIYFDQQGYDDAIEKARKKVELYKKAHAFVSQYVDVDNSRRFADSFTGYFVSRYYSLNKEKIQLQISPEKLIDLMEIDLVPLRECEEKYKLTEAEIAFNGIDAVPVPDVDRKPYEAYTESATQNEMLRDTKRFIEALNGLKKHVAVTASNIIAGTSNLVGYDVRKQEYVVNHNLVRILRGS